MKNSSKIAASVALAAVLIGGGSAAAFAAEPTPAQTHAAASASVDMTAFPKGNVYKIEGASMGGTYHTKETGSQKIVSLWGSLNTDNTASSFTIKLADGAVINMPATKAFSVNGGTGVLKTSYAYGTDYKHSITFTDVRNAGSYAFANVDEPGLHLRNVQLEVSTQLTGNYEFTETPGTYNGQSASVSYGNVDFADNSGQLVIDDQDGGSIADFKFTNVAQDGNTIKLTTTDGKTITLNRSGSTGNFYYSMTGAGTHFDHVLLIQD